MRYFLFINLVIFSMILASCGGSGSDTISSSEGTTAVAITLGQNNFSAGFHAGLLSTQAIPPSVDHIVIKITAPDMQPIESKVIAAGKSSVEEHFEVPNGSNRHFEVFAYDANDILLYKGDTYADMNGTPVTLTIVMVATDTTPPMFSGLSSIDSITETSLALSWSPAVDNITPQGSIQYLIYMSITSGGQNFASPSFATTPGVTSYTVAGLNPGTTYYFIVRAEDKAKNTDSNNVEKSAVTFAEGPPESVTGVWEVHFKCTEELSDVIVLEVTINESGGSFTGSGDGFDYPGTPIHMELSGTYNASTHHLTGTVTTTSEGDSCVRVDTIEVTLTSNSTGYVNMTQTQVCGCDGQVLMIQKIQ